MHKASCLKTIPETSAAIFENSWKIDKTSDGKYKFSFFEGDDDGRWGILDQSA